MQLFPHRSKKTNKPSQGFAQSLRHEFQKRHAHAQVTTPFFRFSRYYN
jgi:hypothetical protein